MIRGFSAISDQYVDGVRDDALYYRDLSNVERVEVLKGPGSVLYGRGSAGGLINRINKKPLDEALHEISLIGSSLGQKRAELDFADALNDQLKVRLTGALEHSDGYRNQSFVNRETVAPSVQWDISDRTTLLLQADYLHDDRLADQGFPMDPLTGKPVRTNPKTFYGASNAKDVGNVDTEVSSQTVTLEHQFNDQLKYRGVARHYNYALDREYSNASPAADQITLSQIKRMRDEDGIFLQNELSGVFHTGQIKHDTLIGTEYSQQHKDEIFWLGSKATTDLYDPVLPHWAPVDTSATPRVNTASEFENYAVYVQDLIILNEQLKLLAGVRYDHLSQYRHDKKNNSNIQRDDQPLSPRLGVVYQPTKNLSLYAAYNQSFQPLADSFVFYSNSADLKPTKTRNLEVGTKWDINDRLNMTLAVFEMTQSNIQNKITDSNPPLAMLAGEQSTQGVEVSLTSQLSEQLSLLAGYAYMDGKIEKSTIGLAGKQAALTPKNSANLWLKYQLDKNWFAAVGGRAESSRFSALDNKNVLPGYAVFNAALGYQTAQYDVALNLNSLFDRDYFISGHGEGNDSNMMGDPLNAQLALRYRF